MRQLICTKLQKILWDRYLPGTYHNPKNVAIILNMCDFRGQHIKCPALMLSFGENVFFRWDLGAKIASFNIGCWNLYVRNTGLHKPTTAHPIPVVKYEQTMPLAIVIIRYHYMRLSAQDELLFESLAAANPLSAIYSRNLLLILITAPISCFLLPKFYSLRFNVIFLPLPHPISMSVGKNEKRRIVYSPQRISDE